MATTPLPRCSRARTVSPLGSTVRCTVPTKPSMGDSAVAEGEPLSPGAVVQERRKVAARTAGAMRGMVGGACGRPPVYLWLWFRLLKRVTEGAEVARRNTEKG